jgi:hypothetical protein
MKLSPSREAANCAATQELPAFYATRMFITVLTRALHWSLSKSQINPVHTIPSYLSKIEFNFVQPPMSGLFPSGFPTNILSLIRATCPAQLILLDPIILIILEEEYKFLCF